MKRMVAEELRQETLYKINRNIKKENYSNNCENAIAM